jgi:hypothetical protein
MKISLTQILGLGVIGLIGYIFYDKRKQTPNQQPTEVEPEVTGGGGGGVFGGGFFPPPAPAPVPAPTTTPTTTTKYTATKTNIVSKFMPQNDKTQSADMNKINRIVLYNPPTTQELKQSCERGFTYSTITKRCEPNRTTTSGTTGGTTGGSTYGGGTSGFKAKQGAEMLFSGGKCLTLDNLLD